MKLPLVMMVCALAGSGCAQTVTVAVWHPAAAEIADIRRMEVADIPGADSAVRRLAETVLVERSKIRPVTSDELNSVRLAAAMGLGDEPADPVATLHIDITSFEAVADGLAPAEDASALAALATSARGLTGALPDEEGVEARARLTVEFRVANGQGRTIFAETVHRDAPVEGKTPDQTRDVLLEECLIAFVSRFSPHEVPVEFELARCNGYGRGHAAVRRGNTAACRSEWGEAVIAWREAIAENPNHDAALFNLAIAAVRAKEFAAAENYALQALRVRFVEQYEQGLSRIRWLREDYRASLQQWELDLQI